MLSGNQMLIDTIEQVVRLPFAAPGARVSGEAALPEARRIAALAQSQHQGTVDAIQNRQGARAEARAREHALIAWRNLQPAITGRKPIHFPGTSRFRLPLAV
jgi:GntR family transcriptional regulator of vanillate catabolism